MDPPPKSSTTTAAAVAQPVVLRHLISLDTKLSQHLHTIAQPFLPHFILLLLEISADFRLFFPISLSFLLSPSLSLLLRPFLSPFLLGLLLDLILIALIKLIFRRSRPHYNKHMNVAVSVDHFSFPSGHASRVFFVAHLFSLSSATLLNVLAEVRARGPLFLGPWIGDDEAKALDFVLLLIWAWAVLTSVSRILLGRHFVFDVFVGACLGLLEALFAFRFLRF